MDLSENETPVLITRPGLPAMIVCVFVNLPVRTVPHATMVWSGICAFLVTMVRNPNQQ